MYRMHKRDIKNENTKKENLEAIDKCDSQQKRPDGQISMICEKDSAVSAGVLDDINDSGQIGHNGSTSKLGYDNAAMNMDDERPGVLPQTINIVKELPALNLEHCKLWYYVALNLGNIKFLKIFEYFRWFRIDFF